MSFFDINDNQKVAAEKPTRKQRAKKPTDAPATGKDDAQAGGATFFDVEPSTIAATPARARVLRDEHGREYTVNSVGDRSYSDGFLPPQTQSPVAPRHLSDEVDRPFGMRSRNMDTAWHRNSARPSTHWRKEDEPSRETQQERDQKLNAWMKAQEWIASVLTIRPRKP